MAHEKIVVGVDIGSTKIAVIAAQGATSGSRQNNIEILGFSEVPVPAGAVVNGSVENIKASRQCHQRGSAGSVFPFGS